MRKDEGGRGRTREDEEGRGRTRKDEEGRLCPALLTLAPRFLFRLAVPIQVDLRQLRCLPTLLPEISRDSLILLLVLCQSGLGIGHAHVHVHLHGCADAWLGFASPIREAGGRSQLVVHTCSACGSVPGGKAFSWATSASRRAVKCLLTCACACACASCACACACACACTRRPAAP